MATYYVSQSGGSDAYSGTLFSPWRNIAYALSQATTGDTILVRGGSYDEKIVIDNANTTLQAYGGETVWIDNGWTAASGVPSWSAYGYSSEFDAAITVDASGCTVDGINVRNSPVRGIRVQEQNCTIKNLTVNTTWGASILLVANVTTAGVIVSVPDGSLVQDCKIIYGSLQMKYTEKGLTYPDTGKEVTNWPHTIASVYAQNTTWRRVEMYECEGEGFGGFRNLNTTIDNCRIVNCSKPMVYANCSPGLQVFDSEIYYTSDYVPPYGSRDFSKTRAITFADEDKALTLLKFDISRGVVIYNNVVAGAHKGLVFAGGTRNSANAVDCLIANNTIIAGTGYSAVYLTNINQSNRTIDNVVIENNVFVGAVTDDTTAGNEIRNLTWRYNYWSQTPSAWMQHADDTSGTIALATTSYTPVAVDRSDVDNHDDFAATDYHLTASSPAVDAAIPNAVTTDYLGYSRDASPDQGFHEYDGSAPDPTVTLTAGFTMSANRVEESTAVTLTDTSTISSGSIDTWAWEYKLSTATSWTSHSTSATPANLTIATAGEYQVRLTVTDTETSQSSAYVLTLTVTAAGEDDVTTCTGNLLSNSDFASGTTGWSFNAGTGGSGSWSAASGYADVTVTTASSTMQLYQTGATITEGTQYRLAFRAKGGQTRTLRAFLFDNTSIQNLGVQAFDFSITTNWLAYEYIFTATNSSTSNARLQFRPGLTTGSVQIDDVCLAPYTAPSAPEAIITIPSNPATLNVEQTLSAASSTGSPTAYSWSIDGVEVGTSSTYAWTPTSPRPHTISLTVTNAYGSDTSTQSVNVTVPGSGGGTSAALLYGAVPGSTGSDGGTDHTDVGTTGGVLLVTSGASTLGTAANDARIGIGGTDGTNHRAVSAHADHGVGTTETRSKSDQATAYLITPTATVVVDGDAALTDADTTTVTYNTVASGLLYGGLRIKADNAAVGDFVPGSTAVNVGFQPDVIFVWGSEGTTDFAGSNDIGLFVTFGFATAGGQRSIAMRSTNGAAATAASAAYSQTYAGMVLTGSAIDDGVTLTITATGFSHTTTGSMTGKMAYMALKLPAGSALEIVDLDTKTTTGTQSHSVSIEATAAVALGTLANVVETVETFDDASAFFVGFWDGTNHRAVAITDDDGAATTVSKSHASNALLLVPSPDGSDNISATVDSVTHSTFVLNYAGVDSTARKSSILLIEGVATGLDDIDYLQPGIQTGTVPGMP